MSTNKHYIIFHSKNEFAMDKNHVNYIENFWNYAKKRISKFNEAPKNNFTLYLKDSE